MWPHLLQTQVKGAGEPAQAEQGHGPLQPPFSPSTAGCDAQAAALGQVTGQCHLSFSQLMQQRSLQKTIYICIYYNFEACFFQPFHERMRFYSALFSLVTLFSRDRRASVLCSAAEPFQSRAASCSYP